MFRTIFIWILSVFIFGMSGALLWYHLAPAPVDVSLTIANEETVSADDDIIYDVEDITDTVYGALSQEVTEDSTFLDQLLIPVQSIPDIEVSPAPQENQAPEDSEENEEVMIPPPIPDGVLISPLPDDRISITYGQFTHNTFASYQDQGVLEIIQMAQCYDQMAAVSGLVPVRSRIVVDVNVGDRQFNTRVNDDHILITKKVGEMSELDYYYWIDEDTIGCTGIEGEPRTLYHELMHAFSSRRHILQEGLAQWGMMRVAPRPASEPPVIECQEDGYVSHRLADFNPAVYDSEYFEYAPYGDTSIRTGIRYQTQYCFWHDLEEMVGASAFRGILQDATRQTYLPPFMTEEEWDMMATEFFVEVLGGYMSTQDLEVLFDRYQIPMTLLSYTG